MKVSYCVDNKSKLILIEEIRGLLAAADMEELLFDILLVLERVKPGVLLQVEQNILESNPLGRQVV